MTTTSNTTIAHYSDNAARFSDRFDLLSFEEVHTSLVAQHIPPSATRVLDVGAGNGRDAEGLAHLGFEVTAVEPAAGLRDIGVARTAGLPVMWVDDALPTLRALSGQWPFILCNAVFQHIPPDMRRAALGRMAKLLAPKGRLYLTMRQGPSEPTRPTYPISQPELAALVADVPLTLAHYEVQREVVPEVGIVRPDVSFVVVRLDRA